jgi:nucleoside 2-deoxyribosyltransferase
MSIKDGVVASIRAADILVFDVTPLAPHRGKPKCPDNVIFEIGVALGLGKPFLLIGAGASAFKALPSDLAGEFVATYGRPVSTKRGSKVKAVERTDELAICAAIIATARRISEAPKR